MRPRSQTIGTLGRAPARQSQPVTPVPPPRPDPREGMSGTVKRWMQGALFENTGLKFLSLVLAVTVFLLVNTDKDREITVRVGVKYDYPPDKVLVSEQLDEARVTIKGPWRQLRRFDERELNRIRLDLSTAPTGDIPITFDMVGPLPPRLVVTSVSPRTVRVAFDKKVEKIVEIVPTTTGHPDYGFTAAETKATPATVRVRGGERLLAALSSVRTSDVDLASHRITFDQPATLVAPDGVEIDPGQRATVHVRIEEELVTRKYPGRPVTVVVDNMPAGAAAPAEPKWTVEPEQVEVTLTGALLAVDDAAKLPLVVHVNFGETKEREAPVVVDRLPPLVGKRISPERVKLTPVAPARPAAPTPAPSPPPTTPTAPTAPTP